MKHKTSFVKQETKTKCEFQTVIYSFTVEK